jgi:hypothetical protein
MQRARAECLTLMMQHSRLRASRICVRIEIPTGDLEEISQLYGHSCGRTFMTLSANLITESLRALLLWTCRDGRGIRNENGIWNLFSRTIKS